MKLEEAVKLRKQWGDKACDHTKIEKENGIMGFSTNDYVCSQCGHGVDKDDWDEKRRSGKVIPSQSILR